MTKNHVKPIIKRLRSVTETASAAAELAGILKAGDLLLFTGEIGAGKTTFIQSLAQNLGITEPVTSPTFVLHAIYESGRVMLSHVDLYRLSWNIEVESFGFEDYYDKAVTVIEWADRYSGFREPYLTLHFEYGELENERILTMMPAGGDWAARLCCMQET